MKRFSVHLLVVALVISAGLVVSGLWAKSAGAACSGAGQNHCYAQVHWTPPNSWTGALAYLNASQLTGSADYFSTHELWVCDPYIAASCWSWVETGYHVGHRFQQGGTGFAWFWAESWDGVAGPDCPWRELEYEEHYPAGFSVGLNQTHVAKISYSRQTPWKWGVYIDGAWIASSRACHSDSSNDIRTGSETNYSDYGKTTADTWGFQKRAMDNQTWSYGWSSAWLQDTPDAQNPNNIFWLGADYARVYPAPSGTGPANKHPHAEDSEFLPLSPDSRWLSVDSASRVTSDSPKRTSLPGLTPEKLATLRERTMRTAREMGEPHPTQGVVIATTQHRFFDAIAGTAGPSFGTPDFDVYVVAYRGSFTAWDTSRPAGAPPPRGNSVYVVHRADTLEVTDWGIGSVRVDPSLGVGPFLPLFDLSS
jgi:hypothetical protein